MDATATFELGGARYSFCCPTPLQLRTVTHVLGAYYEAPFVRASLGIPRAIVDVGACVGSMSLSFATAWPEAEILAMEPHPISFSYLVRNCQGRSNIYPVRIALSDREEDIELSLPSPEQRPEIPDYSRRANVGMASRYGHGAEYAASAKAVRLDDLELVALDLLKIDVEGSEAAVLLGASGTIERYRPLIAIELREANQKMAGGSVAAIRSMLEAMGYIARGQLFQDPLYAHRERLQCSS